MSRWLAVLFVAILLCLIIQPAGAENRPLPNPGILPESGGSGVPVLLHPFLRDNRTFSSRDSTLPPKGRSVPTGYVPGERASLPFSFIPNTGQIADRNISFLVHGTGSTLYFTQTEVILYANQRAAGNTTAALVRQSFPGANREAAVSGEYELPGKASFLIGRDPSRWRQNIPTYGAVLYHDLYPGIDLRYSGSEGNLKREFTLAPGADPGLIMLRYSGITGIRVDADGSLNVTTGNGAFRESPPVSYQVIDGHDVNISVRYEVTGPDTVRFVAGRYNPGYPLVIDPKLHYSTYYGGTNNDGAIVSGSGTAIVDQRDAIAVDTSGNAYVTGYTISHDFPTTSGVVSPNPPGTTTSNDDDIFVLKLNPSGTAAIWSTYYGGSLDDFGDAVAVDSGGNVYVTGYTDSTDFPTTAGACNTTYIGGSDDAFVVKLKPDGSAALWSTYYGGTDLDQALGIAIDSSSDVYITGQTLSTNFLTTAGAFDTTGDTGTGFNDIFVTKLKPDGSAPVYSTYYGGDLDDEGHGIALDSDGDAYITGHTHSGNFPVTAGAYQTARSGSLEDAVVIKLNPSGSAALYSTYFGGKRNDFGNYIAVDDTTRDAYVTGETFSTTVPDNFPTTAGVVNQTKINTNSTADIFVMKLNPAGSSLLYSTYYGGTSDDYGTSLAISSTGDTYITGYTRSTDFHLTSDALQTSHGGGTYDAFLVRLNSGATAPLYATYYGGNSDDYGMGIALDSVGSAFVVGSTSSTNFPTSTGAVYTSRIGNSDAFIFKFFMNPPVSSFATNASFGYVPQGIQFNDTSTSFGIQYWNWSFGDNSWFNTTDSTVRNVTHTYTGSGSYTVNLTITNATTSDTKSQVNDVNISAAVPVPAFTSNTTSGHTPLAVQFNDTTLTTNVLSWNWSFDDNSWFNTTDSTLRNVTHTYALAGTFTVNLSITNSSGLAVPSSNTNTTSRAGYLTIVALPVPAFNGSPQSGAIPLNVQFNDTSLSPGITMWNWSFGDNSWFNTTDSTLHNATHLYSSVGSFTVGLQITNVSGTNTTSRPGYIVTSPPPPVPGFTGSPQSGTVPLNVQFNDTSLSPGVTTWNWSFGDNAWFNTTDSMLRNATHIYSSVGSFTVGLQLTNSSGTNTTTQTGFIVASAPPPVPQFAGSPQSGAIPLNVQFNDTSLSPGITLWNWSFGDGTWTNTTNSALRNATHVYSSVGSFTVGLQLTNSSGTNTTSQTGYIVATPPPFPAFTGSPQSGSIPLSVQFNDTSLSPGITLWNWSFGDNSWFNTTNSALRNATHSYAAAGSYTVGLQLTNASGTNTTSKSGYIVAGLPLPVPDFTGSPQTGGISLSVQFNDTSLSPGITLWNWSFGDSTWFNTTASASRNATHVYTAQGSYTVALQLTNTSGTNTTSKSGYITAGPPLPVPDFTGSPTSGDPPLAVQFNDTSLSPGITTWNWSFGDNSWFNTTDTLLRNASHSYAVQGSYTVGLQLTNVSGTNTASKAGYIVVGPPPPVPDFTGSPQSGTIPFNVQFNDTSLSPGITVWNWSFGDGAWFNTTNSALRNATHSYTIAGTYRVSLSETNSTGNNTISRAGYITANPVPTTTQAVGGGSGSGAGTGSSSSGGEGPVVVQAGQPQPGTAVIIAPEAVPQEKSRENPPSYYLTTTTVGILPPGLRTPAADKQSFILSRTTAEKAGYSIEVQGDKVSASRSGSTLVITGANLQETPAGLITGSVGNVVFVVQPDPAQVTVGTVGVAAQASLPSIPETAGVSVTLTDLVPDQTLAGFRQAAAREGEEIASVGYTATFRKEGILATGPGMIRMTVPGGWVNRNGGIAAVRIARIGDDKVTEILATSYTGNNVNGDLNFEAPTPRGLSIFGLVAVKCGGGTGGTCGNTSQAPRPGGNKTAPALPLIGGAVTGYPLVAVVSLVILAILIIVAIRKRRRKYDWLFMR